MTAHPNSIRAYIKKVLSPGGCKAQRDMCFKAVLDNHPIPINNRMIKNLTGLEINIVSPRVNSLVVPPRKDPDREMPLLDMGTWEDPKTGYETRFVGLNLEHEPRAIQFELKGISHDEKTYPSLLHRRGEHNQEGQIKIC